MPTWNILELVLSVSCVQRVCKTLFVYLMYLRDVFGSFWGGIYVLFSCVCVCYIIVYITVNRD